MDDIQDWFHPNKQINKMNICCFFSPGVEIENISFGDWSIQFFLVRQKKNVATYFNSTYMNIHKENLKFLEVITEPPKRRPWPSTTADSVIETELEPQKRTNKYEKSEESCCRRCWSNCDTPCPSFQESFWEACCSLWAYSLKNILAYFE